MTAKPTGVACSCGARATAAAYGLLLCIGCYSEHGLDSALLLGGRRPIFARPETDPRLLDVLGSEDAAVERLIEEFDATEIGATACTRNPVTRAGEDGR